MKEIHNAADSESMETDRTKSEAHDTFKWAKVCPSAIFNTPSTTPLPREHVEVIFDDLDWDEIEWGPTSVRIRGCEYEVQTVLFKPIRQL